MLTCTEKSPLATLWVASITVRIGFNAFLLRKAVREVPSKMQKPKKAMSGNTGS